MGKRCKGGDPNHCMDNRSHRWWYTSGDCTKSKPNWSYCRKGDTCLMANNRNWARRHMWCRCNKTRRTYYLRSDMYYHDYRCLDMTCFGGYTQVHWCSWSHRGRVTYKTVICQKRRKSGERLRQHYNNHVTNAFYFAVQYYFDCYCGEGKYFGVYDKKSNCPNKKKLCWQGWASKCYRNKAKRKLMIYMKVQCYSRNWWRHWWGGCRNIDECKYTIVAQSPLHYYWKRCYCRNSQYNYYLYHYDYNEARNHRRGCTKGSFHHHIWRDDWHNRNIHRDISCGTWDKYCGKKKVGKKQY